MVVVVVAAVAAGPVVVVVAHGYVNILSDIRRSNLGQVVYTCVHLSPGRMIGTGVMAGR